MKYVFILDENVFIQSHTCRNVQNTQDDYTSLRLILHILEECHKIGFTTELKERYWKIFKCLEKAGKIDSKTARIWRDLLSRSDKYRYCGSSLKKVPSNLEHDRHVIEPTVFLSGILVTMDEKLKQKLREWSKLETTSPTEALVLAVI